MIPGINDETSIIYRAVGGDEYRSVLENNCFSLISGGVGIKYFGLNLQETIVFAGKDLNVDVVAILEVVINRNILNKIGDFTSVDTYIFKSGTVEIAACNLQEFNESICEINHVY
jgi:hypothetical protein